MRVVFFNIFQNAKIFAVIKKFAFLFKNSQFLHDFTIKHNQNFLEMSKAASKLGEGQSMDENQSNGTGGIAEEQEASLGQPGGTVDSGSNEADNGTEGRAKERETSLGKSGERDNSGDNDTESDFPDDEEHGVLVKRNLDLREERARSEDFSYEFTDLI